MRSPILFLIVILSFSLCLASGCTDILGSAGGVLDTVSPGLSPGSALSTTTIPTGNEPEPTSPQTFSPATAETTAPPPVTTTVLQATTPVTTVTTPTTAIPTPATPATTPPTPDTTPATTVTTPATTITTSTPAVTTPDTTITPPATTITTPPTAIPTAPEGDIPRGVELVVFRLTNEERAKQGIAPLVWDDALAVVARDHSTDMAEHHFFSHTNLQSEGPTERAERHGYPIRKDLGGGWYAEGIGENINQMPTGNVVGYGYVNNDAESVARIQIKAWMESPGHRENILKGQYTNLGVGTAYDGTYYYTTQNFW